MVDALVVGGGPAGCAAAYWLARAGRSVVLAERKRYPRDKTCGDGLTPRAVSELLAMGFDLSGAHRVAGLRFRSGHLVRELAWPGHPGLPNWGAVLRRADLDAGLAALAAAAGADVREGTEAAPQGGGPTVAGVALRNGAGTEVLHPGVVVVADGSLARFGRQLGVARDRSRPLGLAARGYYRSPQSDDRFLEVALRARDAHGRIVPGYGWVFPMGGGLVNLGAITLASSGRWKGINTTELMDRYAATVRAGWGLPEEPEARPRGGMLPAGLASGPRAGPNWLVAGDGAGVINPFTGEGISYALVTGRMAAEFASGALDKGFGTLAAYPDVLDRRFGAYYRLARGFLAAAAAPGAMRAIGDAGMRSPRLLEAAVRVMLDMRR